MENGDAQHLIYASKDAFNVLRIEEIAWGKGDPVGSEMVGPEMVGPEMVVMMGMTI